MSKEELEKVLLLDYEVAVITKEILSKEFQRVFNKNLDYNQFVGINDFLMKVGSEVNKTIKEHIDLNYEALNS